MSTEIVPVKETQNLITSKERMNTILRGIGAIQVNKETLRTATENLAKLRTFIKDADKLREQDKSPYLEGGRQIDKFYAEMLIVPKEEETKLNNSICKFNAEEQARIAHEQELANNAAKREFERKQAAEAEARRQEEEARKREEAALAAAEAARKKHDAEAEAEAHRLAEEARKEAEKAAHKAEQVAPIIPEPVARIVEQAPTTIKTDTSTVSFRKVKKWRYVNDNQKTKRTSSIPDEYWFQPQVNEKLITSSVNNGIPNIPGIVIYEEQETVTRMKR